jgi:hypothetical protein
MTKSKFNKQEPKSKREEFFDAILGPDEEITERAAEEILSTYELTGEELVNNFKARLQQRIKQLRDETGGIPESLAATLRNVSDYQKERAPKTFDADETVQSIFSEVPLPKTSAQPLYSTRNRTAGEVSEKDKKILNEITAELEESGD